MPYFSHDDIAQIGAPPGDAATGALRMSGAGIFAILKKTTAGIAPFLENPERTVRGGALLVTLAGKTYPCPARFFLMPAPASYTREHTAEIHLPASGAVLKAALSALTGAGARPAAPGEFTFRAFRNGRISLAQAEAVEEVVRAENAAERRQALSRLRDGSSGRIAAWRGRLADVAARIEAVLDFSEEEDVDQDAAAALARVANELDDAGLAVGASERDVSNGLPHIALTGLANAGKSSLMNALLGGTGDAVLVSPEASTTRDSIRREVEWHGTKFILSDNPGFQAGSEDGENNAGDQAAARAVSARGGEDAVCWVLDASRPMDAETRQFAVALTGNVMLVLNKTDLPKQTDESAARRAAPGANITAAIETSAANNAGVEKLRAVLANVAAAPSSGSAWNRREAAELASARECCRRAAKELAGEFPVAPRLELAAEDVRRGLSAFSRAMGEGYAEDVLGKIFSKFCIGK